MKFTILEIAIHKCKQFCNTPQWVGCLTPSEIFALIKAGVKPAHEYQLDYIKKCKDAGECGKHWFYFYPNGVKMNKEEKKCRKHLTR